jgi:hypothetical protein
MDDGVYFPRWEVKDGAVSLKTLVCFRIGQGTVTAMRIKS